MMRLIFFISMSLMLLSKDIVGFGWQTWFYAHQKEIAEKKCENKAIPMLHCNGKCYLSKQLKKWDLAEKEHEQKQNPTHGIELIYFFQPNLTGTSFLYPIEFNQKEMQLFSYHFSIQTNEYNACFHPPCCA